MAEPEPPPTWRFYIPKDVPIINIIYGCIIISFMDIYG
jgi:hypothetical protein